MVECGNPLLRDWVKEWMEQTTVNSKPYFTYKRAYESLCKCTEVFIHPSQAETLAGIGPTIAGKLVTTMEKYCRDNNLPMPEKLTKVRKSRKPNANDTDTDQDSATSTPRSTRQPKAYIPKYRSGGYGIMLCLLDFHDSGRDYASKDQICRQAQSYCSSSLTISESGGQYTAFSSMKTLIEKGYVWKNGTPAKYCLTDTGVEVAKQLKEVGSGSGISSNGATPNTEYDDGGVSTLRIPSAASSASSRIKNVSRNMDLLNSMVDFDDDTPNEIDMSLYVTKPSVHQSITVNDRTYLGATALLSRPQNTENILQALADASRPQKRQRANNSNNGGGGGGGGGSKRQRIINKKTSTASAFDKILAELEAQGMDSSNSLNMSHYVQDTSGHKSISLGNKTVHNKPTELPARNDTPFSTFTTPVPSNNISFSRTLGGSTMTPTASSVTSASRSSFARRVASADETDDYDSFYSRYNQTTSSSRKYTTPSSSVLLKNQNKSKKPAPAKKSIYNEDDYVLDMTSSSLPTFASSQASNVQLEEIVDLLSSSPSPSPPLRPIRDAMEGVSTFDDNFDVDTDYFPLSQQRTEQVISDTFHYTYLDSNGEAAKHVTKAAVIVAEDQQCLAYHIRFFTNQTLHPKFNQIVQVQQDKDHAGCSIGYLLETHRDMIAPGLPAKPILPLHREDADNFWPSSFSSKSNREAIPQDHTDHSARLFIPSSQQSSSQPQSQQREVDYDQLVETIQPAKMFLPNEYEIILVLDSREIQMQQDRDYFQRKLTEKGIQLMTRSMELGDMIWIARKIGSQNQADELYLDYIVERKRLDDLVSSIKDGRFIEQKTRLKRSGSTKVIYVIEEFNREEAERWSAQAIQTAMSSTQIIDGIFLKRTNNIDGTIDYLVSVTKLIKRLYQDTTLYAIPDDIITRQNYVELKKAYRARADKDTASKSAYLVNYPMFGELNTKSGTTTLHDVYRRMLMVIKGVNAERALALMKIYPTPRALLKAFSGKSVNEAKNMLKDATAHEIQRRRWAGPLSEKLFEVWGALEYPNSVPEDED